MKLSKRRNVEFDLRGRYRKLSGLTAVKTTLQIRLGYQSLALITTKAVIITVTR